MCFNTSSCCLSAWYAVCRDRSGEPVDNKKALEILTEQLETHEKLLAMKKEIGSMAK